MDSPAVHPQVEAVAAEIAAMEVRGASTIAETAANALRVQAEESEATTVAEFDRDIRTAGHELVETRPTAVSLPNAVRFVLTALEGETVADRRESVVAAVSEFVDRLVTAQDELGRIGAERLGDGDTIMTHCHSTDALACVEAAVDQGKTLQAYVKETRPRKQGHITARALDDLGVSVTLIVDGAARHYLAETDHVLVGADSVAASGAVVNKIGTSSLAVNARDRDVPVTVAAQTVKFHPEAETATAIEIERRDETEVVTAEDRDELGTVEVANPAFDVTPPELIDAIVTEDGVFAPEEIAAVQGNLFGDEPVDPWME